MDHSRSWRRFPRVLVAVQWLCGFAAVAAVRAETVRAEKSEAGSSAPAAPALRLVAELAWQPLHAGDPLRIRVRLSSPRARQEALLLARGRERGEPARGPAFAPPPITGKAFAERVAFRLHQLGADGSRRRILERADWTTFRVRPRDELTDRLAPLVAHLGLTALTEEWLVPPDLLPGGGRYLLEVEWIGKGLVEASLLGRKGSLEAAPLAFELVPATEARQRAVREERLAYLASVRGRHAEALAHGREALRLDPAFSPARVDTYLLVADSALALEDFPAAAAAYRELLGHLPSPPRDDLSLAVNERLKLLERVRP